MAHSKLRAGDSGTKKASPDAGSTKLTWDSKIEQHLRAKSQGELADLAWSLVRRFPEIYKEFRERLVLEQGDVDQLMAEARREIKQVTSETGWQNHWTDLGHVPDYSKVQRCFERLLELGHADLVVSLGRDFLARAMDQIAESHDEGETATAFAECVPVVFQAVIRSTLSGPERLLFAIDAAMADNCDALGDSTGTFFDAPGNPEDWSVVADTLIERMKIECSLEKPGESDFSRNYRRDGVSNWIATALEKAGRSDELRALYESEARSTDSYERLVAFLLDEKQFEDAKRWALEGIAATSAKFPGIAASLARKLCDLAQKHKQWEVVAAHAAFKFFFDRPSVSGFDELVKAAGKAGVEEPVRAAALKFLETGTLPFQVSGQAPPAATVKNLRTQSPLKTRGAATKAKVSTSSPELAPAAPNRVKTDPSWPLPVPDYFNALLNRSAGYDTTPQPHLEVLLEMALAAKRPDEILHWFDKMNAPSRGTGHYHRPYGYTDRVAKAVSAEYPERAIAIYTAALNAQLPHPDQSSYESATANLKKLRPLYEALDRASEWTALVASIREKYRNRPRFMDLLKGLESRSNVRSAPTPRK